MTRAMWLMLAFVVAFSAVGCASTPLVEERAWPTGLPEDAVLFGGGLVEDDISFPADGYVIAVDAETNAAVMTVQVQAGQEIGLSPEMVIGGAMMSRHGLRGGHMVGQMSNGEADAAMSDEPIRIELYFVPVTEVFNFGDE